jgi:GNAT superfamily N-acetyltransferase
MAEMNYFEMNGEKFDPDYAGYIRGQTAGKIVLITAKDDGILVGYIVFCVNTHIRYKSTLYASEDLYYVVPSHRRQGIAKRLFEVAEKTLAVITYGGYSSDEKIEKHCKQLEQILQKNKMKTKGAYMYMGYNAPWDIINRKNEVAIELAVD